MASASEDNRFAPPLAHVEDVVESGTGALAGRGVRLVAALLDALFAGIAFWILSFVTPLNWTPPAGANIVRALIINAVVGFIIFLVLHGYLLATRGQTIAKALLKVRIVRSDGGSARKVCFDSTAVLAAGSRLLKSPSPLSSALGDGGDDSKLNRAAGAGDAFTAAMVAYSRPRCYNANSG